MVANLLGSGKIGEPLVLNSEAYASACVFDSTCQIHGVLRGHPDAAMRRGIADGFGIVRTVDVEVGRVEVDLHALHGIRPRTRRLVLLPPRPGGVGRLPTRIPDDVARPELSR